MDSNGKKLIIESAIRGFLKAIPFFLSYKIFMSVQHLPHTSSTGGWTEMIIIPVYIVSLIMFLAGIILLIVQRKSFNPLELLFLYLSILFFSFLSDKRDQINAKNEIINEQVEFENRRVRLIDNAINAQKYIDDNFEAYHSYLSLIHI